jgi:phage-related protein
MTTLRQGLVRKTRPISWVQGALKAYRRFPPQAQTRIADALTIAAEGGKSDNVKPLVGFGSGVFEIAVAYHGDAFRAVYAVQVGDAVWVVHAFQKKSKRGIQTPRHEIEVIRDRIARLRGLL